ncbi:translation initiation factor eIF4A [Dissophora globulifera]|nr:translation initiation factor eIF4A [Dissophora globulifera]
MTVSDNNNTPQLPDTNFESNWDEIVDSFDKMNLKPELLRGISAHGFERPTNIQQRVIVPALEDRDVIAQAQSGTGKTTAFSIAVLQKLDVTNPQCQALVITQTRELAQQIQKVVLTLGDFMKVQCHACTNVLEDTERLSQGSHVVLGTPGRVFDMINRGVLRTESVKVVILDDADEMISRGFKDHIYELFLRLPQNRQVILLSGTLSIEVMEISNKFMKDPIRITMKNNELSLEGIKQFHIQVEKEDWKLDTLCDMYETITINQAVIFCNTRQKVEWLTNKLTAREMRVSEIHNDMGQKQRELIMREFRSGSSPVLIATDQLDPSIDGQQVSLVVNFDLPTNKEIYIHRVGRRGRPARKKAAVNFVTLNDVGMLREIEQLYSIQIPEMPMNIKDLI